jgi:hypothetical protein
MRIGRGSLRVPYARELLAKVLHFNAKRVVLAFQPVEPFENLPDILLLLCSREGGEGQGHER